VNGISSGSTLNDLLLSFGDYSRKDQGRYSYDLIGNKGSITFTIDDESQTIIGIIILVYEEEIRS
jgi:hypothetical protein